MAKVVVGELEAPLALGTTVMPNDLNAPLSMVPRSQVTVPASWLQFDGASRKAIVPVTRTSHGSSVRSILVATRWTSSLSTRSCTARNRSRLSLKWW